MKNSSWFRTLILLTCGTLTVFLRPSAAGARPRIHAPAIPSDRSASEPGRSRRNRFSIESAPIYRCPAWAERGWHGSCADRFEAESDAPSSSSQESCWARRRGQETDRNRRASHKALAFFVLRPSPKWFARMLRKWRHRKIRWLAEAAESTRVRLAYSSS